jgi:membrane-associated phospholipid phosphatase
MRTNNRISVQNTRMLLWCGIALFILALVCFIIWPHLGPVLRDADIGILRVINSHRFRSLDPVFLFITNTSSIVYITIIAIIAVIGWINRSPLLKLKALQLFTGFLVSYVAIKTLKFTIGRERPFTTYHFLDQLATVDSPSFPSGHTFEACALAMGMMLLFRNSLLNVTIMVWAIMVGLSRMILGVHYFSDVIAGMILGVVTAYLVHLYFLSIPGRKQSS